MIDAALIEECADRDLKPAVVERFIKAAGSSDPLSIMVRSGDRLILVPKARAHGEAMEIIRRHVASSVVRVGITQYPASFAFKDMTEAGAPQCLREPAHGNDDVCKDPADRGEVVWEFQREGCVARGFRGRRSCLEDRGIRGRQGISHGGSGLCRNCRS